MDELFNISKWGIRSLSANLFPVFGLTIDDPVNVEKSVLGLNNTKLAFEVRRRKMSKEYNKHREQLIQEDKKKPKNVEMMKRLLRKCCTLKSQIALHQKLEDDIDMIITFTTQNENNNRFVNGMKIASAEMAAATKGLNTKDVSRTLAELEKQINMSRQKSELIETANSQIQEASNGNMEDDINFDMEMESMMREFGISLPEISIPESPSTKMKERKSKQKTKNKINSNNGQATKKGKGKKNEDEGEDRDEDRESDGDQ